MSSDMTRYGHKRLYGSTIETLLKIGYFDSHKNTSLLIFPFTNYYKGFSLNFICSVTYYTTLLSTFKINNNNNKLAELNGFYNKFIYYFGPSVIGSIIASAISYPFDTVKRQIQVNGSLGFNKLYFSILHCFKMNYDSGIQSFYK